MRTHERKMATGKSRRQMRQEAQNTPATDATPRVGSQRLGQYIQWGKAENKARH